jgi:hypothetical protein
MDFDARLRKAIERGHRTGSAEARREAERAMSEQELRRLHTQYRLELSEHVESCLKKLPQHFPGFRFETVVSERGWGGAVSRDDVGLSSQGQRANYFSHLEIVIRPISEVHVLEVAAKGAIRNKEIFSRAHYERLADVDLGTFTELIDRWVLEYAELYAAKG